MGNRASSQTQSQSFNSVVPQAANGRKKSLASSLIVRFQEKQQSNSRCSATANSTNRSVESSQRSRAPSILLTDDGFQQEFDQVDELDEDDSPHTHIKSSSSFVFDEFDFDKKESQIRIERMAECEFECSQITDFLYVSGYYVAGDLGRIRSNEITQVINCAASVVGSHFMNLAEMKYLNLHMVDGKQDDISWFVCDVIQCIIKAKEEGRNVLLHCEKGVSRSCSFAIAFMMWLEGECANDINFYCVVRCCHDCHYFFLQSH